MTRRGWIVAGYLLAFSFGAVSGAAIVEGRTATRQTALFGPLRKSSAFMTLLEQRLDLSPSQRDEVEKILSRYETERRAALAPVEPQLQETRDAMRHSVRETLSPNQQTDFDALVVEFDKARESRRLKEK
jgi:hypothetical protein